MRWQPLSRSSGSNLYQDRQDRWITCGDESLIIELVLPLGEQAHPYFAVTAIAGEPRPRPQEGPDLEHREPALLGEPRPETTDEAPGVLLDLKRFVRPFVTPDDPVRFQTVLAGADRDRAQRRRAQRANRLARDGEAPSARNMEVQAERPRSDLARRVS